jgi:hypothetical protein
LTPLGVIAAPLVSTLHRPNGIDLLIEYGAAFVVDERGDGRDDPDHGAAGAEMEMGHGHEMRELPFPQAAAWVGATLALALAAAWVTSRFAPISFTD